MRMLWHQWLCNKVTVIQALATLNYFISHTSSAVSQLLRRLNQYILTVIWCRFHARHVQNSITAQHNHNISLSQLATISVGFRQEARVHSILPHLCLSTLSLLPFPAFPNPAKCLGSAVTSPAGQGGARLIHFAAFTCKRTHFAIQILFKSTMPNLYNIAGSDPNLWPDGAVWSEGSEPRGVKTLVVVLVGLHRNQQRKTRCNRNLTVAATSTKQIH